MAVRHYLGVAEPGPENWSISFPAFPGVVTVGDTLGNALAHAQDALQSAIEAMQDDGAAIPPDVTTDPQAPGYDPLDYSQPRAVLVGVEFQIQGASRSERV